MMSPSPATRTESDTFGPIEVPADRYWGAQTQRSTQNFRIGGERMPIPLIHALGLVKQAAALVNKDLGVLEPRLADAIANAAAEVVQGRYDDEFPLVVWQTGSGTQSNMNVNEVIANLANEALGGKRGERRRSIPNDHVNRGQSSNDRFPTAMHIAAAREIAGAPPAGAAPPAGRSHDEGGSIRRHRQNRPHPPAGRDPGHARPGILRLRRAGRARHRAHRGDAAGRAARSRRAAPRSAPASTPIRSSPSVRRQVAELTGLPFVTAANKFEALASHDALVFAHGALKTLAARLFKIANDIRLMGSGPRSRHRRDHAPGERARLLDHAGQGQPDPVPRP